MIEILSVINKFLDLKIVQWGLVAVLLGGIIFSVYFGFKYNTLKLEHAYLEVEATKINNALNTQNEKIRELGDIAKKYQDYYIVSVKKAQAVQEDTAKSLKALSEYTFEGDCQQNVRTALDLIQRGK